MKVPSEDLPWIGTSWKMNLTLDDARNFATALRAHLNAKRPQAHVFVVPAFTALASVCDVLDGSPVMVGAQNVHWEDAGAFTGEVSCPMVADCGAKIVEIGHSERRAYFGETDTTVNLKVRAALRNGLRPLVCVGESSDERRCGAAYDSVCRQIAFAFDGLSAEQAAGCILAYEPVWAIGEGATPASPDDANNMLGAVRARLGQRFGAETGWRTRLLYGGSINAGNALGLLHGKNVDGLFIGRAAWSCERFIEILNLVEEQYVKAVQ